jgi:hypothetical protein
MEWLIEYYENQSIGSIIRPTVEISLEIGNESNLVGQVVVD